YFWINDHSLQNLGEPLAQIKEIANTAIDEFVKVQAQRKHAVEILEVSEKKLEDFTFDLNSTIIETLDQLVNQLAQSRRLQGELIDIKNVRYMNIEKVDELLTDLDEKSANLSEKTIEFLLREEALIPYEEKVQLQKQKVEEISKVFDAKAVEEANAEISTELELLIDILNSLKIE